MAIEAAFLGTLGSDAEQKVSKTDKLYLRMNVRAGDGDAAVWIGVMAFDRDAVDRADKFVKGARIYVEGRLNPTTWTAQDGTTRHGLSVMSWHCRLAQIGRKREKRDGKRAKSAARVGTFGEGPTADRALDDEIPF